jgi:subtilisin family serine protease
MTAFAKRRSMKAILRPSLTLRRLAFALGVALLSGGTVLALHQQSTDSYKWGLDRIDQSGNTLNGYYTYRYDGNGVGIFILDSGVYAGHNDFTGRVVSRGNFCETEDGEPTDMDTSDSDGHGTHVASAAAGAEYGVAKGATIYAMKVDCGNNDEEENGNAAAAAVSWITSNGNGHLPAVINISGRYSGNSSLQAALHTAITAGFVVVLSGGCTSEGLDVTWGYEAGEAIVVGSMAYDRSVSEYNYNDHDSSTSQLSLYAPAFGFKAAGIGSISDAPELAANDGNCADSYAAAVVSGIVARYLQVYPSASPSTVKADLEYYSIKGQMTGIVGNSRNYMASLEFLNSEDLPPVYMHDHSAVRGCSNYSELGAVYKPDSESCLAYCEYNSASACEWDRNNGDCYAEYGTGCYVESGYGGWDATVIIPEESSSAAPALYSPPVFSPALPVGTAQSPMVADAPRTRRHK